MKIAVIGDSLCTTRQGAGKTSIARQLEGLMRDGGLPQTQIINFAIPGMTWKGARVPTPWLLYGGKESPVDAVMRSSWDWILVCLGVNDRANPDASADASQLRDALAHVTGRKVYVRQHFHDDRAPDATLVTKAENERMQAVYDLLPASLGMSFWAAYDCGMTYDKLHPTDKGVVWLAASLYRGMEALLPLTPIGWNLARLWTLKQGHPDQFRQALEVAS